MITDNYFSTRNSAVTTFQWNSMRIYFKRDKIFSGKMIKMRHFIADRITSKMSIEYIKKSLKYTIINILIIAHSSYEIIKTIIIKSISLIFVV